MDPNTATEAGQIAALAKAAFSAEPKIIRTDEGAQILVYPEGYNYAHITPENGEKTLHPDHIGQLVRLQTTDSLASYLNRFKQPETTLFADIAASTILGAIDYHGEQANLVRHRATLTLPFSVEWGIWTGIDGKLQSQLDFARFLEENADDISHPVAADLLEIVRDMQAVSIENTVAKVRTNSDNVDFEFKANTDARAGDGGKFEIPKAFGLFIPVYFGETPVPIEARLRWRKTDQGLQFGVMLMRKEVVRQAEFQRVVQRVVAATDLQAVYGAIA